jgi:predicted DNA-binding protein (UPF0278 family)
MPSKVKKEYKEFIRFQIQCGNQTLSRIRAEVRQKTREIKELEKKETKLMLHVDNLREKYEELELKG